MSVLHAYEQGKINDTEYSIRKWHDTYNSPLGTSVSDIQNIQDIINYHKAVH